MSAILRCMTATMGRENILTSAGREVASWVGGIYMHESLTPTRCIVLSVLHVALPWLPRLLPHNDVLWESRRLIKAVVVVEKTTHTILCSVPLLFAIHVSVLPRVRHQKAPAKILFRKGGVAAKGVRRVIQKVQRTCAELVHADTDDPVGNLTLRRCRDILLPHHNYHTWLAESPPLSPYRLIHLS